MSADEVFPRHSATFQRASRFRQILDNCNLFSEDALGCKFSWCRIQHGRVMLWERLDRVLFNAQAKVQFQGAKLINLPRTCNDHHPILLNLDTAASQPPPYKPHRFEAVWLTREEFSRVFSQAWGQYPLDMKAAIENTSSACMSWGREVFGNIFRRKRLLRARIAGIQNSPSYGSSAPLQSLEKHLLQEYQQALFEEEVLWLQKSRVDWIASGDRNTSFYHMSTVTRRCNNKIGALKVDGVWSNNPEVLKQHVRDFYTHLFS
ncbi:hypothetical protein SLE2022_215670 [Rubroshorea leprosula]